MRRQPRRGRDETDTMAEMIGRLDRRLDQFANASRPMAPPLQPPAAMQPAMPPPAPIDRAVAEITARQRCAQRSAGRQARRRWPGRCRSRRRAPCRAQDISGLEDQLRQITDQIETLRRPGVEEAINALREELGEIGHALTEAMPRRAIDAIEKQIAGLSQRIAEGRQSGNLPSMARRAGQCRARAGRSARRAARADPGGKPGRLQRGGGGAGAQDRSDRGAERPGDAGSNSTAPSPRCARWQRTLPPTKPSASWPREVQTLAEQGRARARMRRAGVPRSIISSSASARWPMRWPTACSPAARCRRIWKRWCNRSPTRSSSCNPRAATVSRWAIWKTVSSAW